MRVAAGTTPPFLVATGEELSVADWKMPDGRPIPRLYHDWDPATPVALKRDVSVDGAQVGESCALRPSTSCRISCMWESTATRLRGSGTFGDFTLGEECHDRVLSIEAPGRELGGTLYLRTLLVALDPHPSGALGASYPGEVLWSDRKKVILEGDDSRFPVNVVDFSQVATLQSSAGWILSWQTHDFEEPFGASLRLLVNDKNPAVVDAVITGGDSDGSVAIRSHIEMDTARTLLDYGLGSDEFLAAAHDYPEGSVGRAIADLANRVFGQMDLAAIRSMRRDQPAEFEARLQALLLPTESE